MSGSLLNVDPRDDWDRIARDWEEVFGIEKDRSVLHTWPLRLHTAVRKC